MAKGRMSFEEIEVELVSSWGDDRSIANNAWASSYDVGTLDSKTDEAVRRVVKDVVTLSHGTPKERVFLEYFITCPIFCERQLDKYRMTLQHQDFQVEYLERSMGGLNVTQNELSGRYRTIPERFMKMPEDVERILDVVDATSTATTDDSVKRSHRDTWTAELERQHVNYRSKLVKLKDAERGGHISNMQYKRAREFLRGGLGTAFLTDMRMVMNLHAFENIVNQRLEPHSQIESRIVAYYMLREALNKCSAKVAIETMCSKHGWYTWMAEIGSLL
jgi:thymidylate synthase ThyX